MTPSRYILTLHCKDIRGIVAAVSAFITKYDGFIIESAQFGDAATNIFFLRMVFETGEQSPDYTSLCSDFATQVGTPFSMQWKIHKHSDQMRVLIMVSKFDHCAQDLLYRMQTGLLPIEVPAIVSNHPNLEPLARQYNIPFYHYPLESGTNADAKQAQEAQIGALIETLDIDVVVLARYMQILSPAMCEKLNGKAINIHHSFLPSFKGARPYHQAFEKGVKIIGATAHYVTTDLDEGPIIEQEVTRVDHTLTPQQLTAAGRDIEAQVLARALRYHVEHRVLLNGKKTVVFK